MLAWGPCELLYEADSCQLRKDAATTDSQGLKRGTSIRLCSQAELWL